MGTPEQTLGQRLRAIRLDRGMTLAQVGAALGCHKTNVSHMEADRHSPGVEQLRAFARIFGCTIDQLVGDLPLPLRAPVVERMTEREPVGMPHPIRDAPPPGDEVEDELRYELDQEDQAKRAGEAA